MADAHLTGAPAVTVHGLDDAVAALREAAGRPLTLLSGPGAARYAGCLWWRELLIQARAAHPDAHAADLLDCGDASGLALAAFRIGLRGIILHPGAPGRPAVLAIAAELGAIVRPARPPALDLAQPGAARRLSSWLAARGAGDTGQGVS